MKTGLLILITSLALYACASAKTDVDQPATQEQTALLCKYVQQIMAEDAVDAGMDLKKCLANKKMISKREKNKTTSVSATLNFKSHSSFPFQSKCKITYKNTPEIKNITGENTFNSVCEQ